MRKPLSRLMRDVLGRNDKVFLALLGSQIDAALEGARVLSEAVAHNGDFKEIVDRLREIEQEGDEHRTELISELSKALTTPIDREDLFRLSRSIDDVLDNLRDFANEYVMFEAQDGTRYGPVLDALVEGLTALRTSVGDLGSHPERVPESSRKAKRANHIHRVYEEALADLFAGEVSMEVFKHRELLRRMDIVGVRLTEAADVLADAALKRH